MRRVFSLLLKPFNDCGRIAINRRTDKYKLNEMAGGGPGSFRYTVWDPLMIMAQMATLQSLYYVSLGLWIFIFDIIQGSPRSLDQIFMYQVWNIKLSITDSLQLNYTKSLLKVNVTLYTFNVFCFRTYSQLKCKESSL